MIKDFTPEMDEMATNLSPDSFDEFESRIDAAYDKDSSRNNVFNAGFKLALQADGRDVWCYDCGGGYAYFIDDGNFVDWLKVLSVMAA